MTLLFKFLYWIPCIILMAVAHIIDGKTITFEVGIMLPMIPIVYVFGLLIYAGLLPYISERKKNEPI